MKTIYDVPAQNLNEALKEELKKINEIKPPEWALYAKSGSHKDKPPVQDDFWYVRTASILRKLSVKGSTGVSRLRTEYGGRKNRGAKPEKHREAGGKMIRVMLQQLESAGLVAKDKKNGRGITAKGQKFIDSIAKNVDISKPKKVEKPKEEKKAETPAEKKPEAPKKEEPKPEAPKEEKPKEEKK
jgi:small subunit ribosomal protein S19e